MDPKGGQSKSLERLVEQPDLKRKAPSRLAKHSAHCNDLQCPFEVKLTSVEVGQLEKMSLGHLAIESPGGSRLFCISLHP